MEATADSPRRTQPWGQQTCCIEWRDLSTLYEMKQTRTCSSVPFKFKLLYINNRQTYRKAYRMCSRG